MEARDTKAEQRKLIRILTGVIRAAGNELKRSNKLLVLCQMYDGYTQLREIFVDYIRIESL